MSPSAKLGGGVQNRMVRPEEEERRVRTGRKKKGGGGGKRPEKGAEKEEEEGGGRREAGRELCSSSWGAPSAPPKDTMSCGSLFSGRY